MQREATCAVSLCPVQHMQKAQRCPEPQIKKQRSPVWSSRGRGRPGRVGAQSATISLEVAGAEITFRRPPGRLRRNACSRGRGAAGPNVPEMAELAAGSPGDRGQHSTPRCIPPETQLHAPQHWMQHVLNTNGNNSQRGHAGDGRPPGSPGANGSQGWQLRGECPARLPPHEVHTGSADHDCWKPGSGLFPGCPQVSSWGSVASPGCCLPGSQAAKIHPAVHLRLVP